MSSQVTGYPKASAGPQKILGGKMHKIRQLLNLGMAEQRSMHHTHLNKANLFTKQRFTKNSVKGSAEKFLSERRMANEQQHILDDKISLLWDLCCVGVYIY